jgi:hypothetical protein
MGWSRNVLWRLTLVNGIIRYDISSDTVDRPDEQYTLSRPASPCWTDALLSMVPRVIPVEAGLSRDVVLGNDGPATVERDLMCHGFTRTSLCGTSESWEIPHISISVHFLLLCFGLRD